MPLTRITNKEYLNELIDLAPTILAEYNQQLDSSNMRKPLHIEGWKILEIFQQGVLTEDADNIPTLKTFLENLPSNVYMSMAVISSLRGGELTDEMIHREPYPQALHRYHIPLHACHNAFLNVQENDGVWNEYTWVDGEVYDFTNPQNNHFVSHNNVSDDRVVIILDVFEDVAPTQDELDLCYKIASSFVESA